MTFIIQVTVFMVVGYLIGGLPFGVWVGRWHGVDIRREGSKNVGATNVGRLLGWKWGLFVFLLDAIKGFVPTLIGGMLLMHSARHDPAVQRSTLEMARVLIAFCCVLGHTYSPFLGFQGGKGVATTLGVTLGIFPDLTYPALGAFAVWIAVALLGRYVSLASMIAALSFSVFYVVLSTRQSVPWVDRWPLLAFVSVVVAMVWLRHRANIRRLWQGTEPRWRGWRRDNSDIEGATNRG